jgi:uroporphyrinogen decarboxylase
MESRERVYRTLKFERPDRAPRDLWIIPAVETTRLAELEAVRERFPLDFAFPNGFRAWNMGHEVEWPDPNLLFRYGPSQRAKGIPWEGTYTDAWGCEFVTGEPGVVGEVKNPPLAEWRALEGYTAPWEILRGARWDAVNRFCAATTKFVLSPPAFSLFERMQFLRGTEALFCDLGYGTREVLRLRDLIHEFNLEAVDLWCQTDADGIGWTDDWGSQTALLVSLDMWREIFQPLYREYCARIHAAGKFAFLHSDGHITALIPELIEIGVDALNSQLFCMDLEELGRRFKGRITFWGEIDRQQVLPFGNPEDVREAVRRVRRALDDGAGGVVAQLQFGKYDPKENIEAAFEAWME